MFTGPLEDRLAIRELNDVYGDGVVRKDGAMSQFDAVSFSCSPASIEVDGDTATARVQTQEILKGKDGSTRHIGGLYTDRLARIDGDWRFTHRGWEMIVEFQAKEA